MPWYDVPDSDTDKTIHTDSSVGGGFIAQVNDLYENNHTQISTFICKSDVFIYRTKSEDLGSGGNKLPDNYRV